MPLQLVKHVDYAGNAGIYQVRNLQRALNEALEQEDWAEVRKLDRTCALVIDKVIAANQHDGNTLATALGELKGVYANLIVQCKREVAAMAH